MFEFVRKRTQTNPMLPLTPLTHLSILADFHDDARTFLLCRVRKVYNPEIDPVLECKLAEDKAVEQASALVCRLEFTQRVGRLLQSVEIVVECPPQTRRQCLDLLPKLARAEQSIPFHSVEVSAGSLRLSSS